MKFTFWNRVWAAVAGLIIFIAGINCLVFSIGIVPFKIDLCALNGSFQLWQRIVMVIASLLLCLLGFHGMWLLFRRKGDKGFIMQHTEHGDMSISMNALESMVHKCVNQHQELSVKSTRIFRSKNGIGVEIRIMLAPGVNIPLTVNALQKQVKNYITSCSGVEVQEIKVMVETTVPKQHFGKEQRDIVVDARKPVAAPEAPKPSMEQPIEQPAQQPIEPPVENAPVIDDEPEADLPADDAEPYNIEDANVTFENDGSEDQVHEVEIAGEESLDDAEASEATAEEAHE